MLVDSVSSAAAARSLVATAVIGHNMDIIETAGHPGKTDCSIQGAVDHHGGRSIKG